MNERDRVLYVMKTEGMNAKQFCQEVGISQGTLSNIIGGRNKPSLDVIQAILRRFRSVNCAWMILGVGIPYDSDGGEGPTLFDEQLPRDVSQPVSSSTLVTQDKEIVVSRSVSKVMIFYSDGTFEER